MLKICVMLGLTLAVGANAAVTGEKPYEAIVEFVSSKDLKSVLAKYPDAIKLNRNTATSEVSSNGQSRSLITYTIGSRVNGDSRVSYNAQSNSWWEPQDVRMTVSYPASGGYGAYVSYVLIDVNQSNASGGAWVTSGGIGKRYITLVVEAEYTYWFNYEISIFGYY